MADKASDKPSPDPTSLEIAEDGTVAALIADSEIIHGVVPGSEADKDDLDDDPEEKDDADDEPDDRDVQVFDDDHPEDDLGKKKPAKDAKFKSLKDAENANLEAQRKISQMGVANAELKAQNESLKSAPKVDDKANQEPSDPIAKITEQTAKEFEQLVYPTDPKDPEYAKHLTEYNQKVADVFARQAVAIGQIQQSKSADKSTTQQTQVKYISERLKEAGLEDYTDTFYQLSPAVPKDIKSFEKAVEWGITNLQGLIVKATKTKDDVDADAADKDGYMAPGKPRKPKKVPVEDDDKGGNSLGDMLGELNEKRRITQ